MKNNKLIPVLFAITAVMIVSLACSALNPTPGASDFYMASDKDGKNKTTTYSPTDELFVFFQVSGIETGTKFQSRWYVLDISDQDPNIPFQTTDYTYESGVSTIYFQLTNDSGWPTGHYRVEIYMNGAKVGEQAFTVQ